MQMKDAIELNSRWGNKPCNHSSVDKEYQSGMSTGDYVCTTCGQSGWGENWPQLEKEASSNKNNGKVGE